MFRRRFHQAGLARFTYKVSSLKMMDLSSLFLPIAFGFLPIAFVLFLKKRAQNPKPRQIRNFPYKTPCACVHNALKSAFFFADCGKNGVRPLQNSLFAAKRTKLPMKWQGF